MTTSPAAHDREVGPHPASHPAPAAEGPAPAVGVVVVSYGSAHLLRANLLGRTWSGRLRVVVVDNHTSAAEAEAVAAVCAAGGFTFVGLPDNRGFAHGCNSGVLAALELGCEAVVLLNPDAAADPGVLLELGDAALADPATLVSPVIEDSRGAIVFLGARLSLADGRVRSDPRAALRRAEAWTTGACVAFSTVLHRRLGGLPEEYFLYWEDIAFSHACLAAGGRLVLRTDLVVRHDAGGTQGEVRGRAKSALYYRWNTRNRLVFAARNLGRRDVIRWLVATPSVSREILLRGGRRQLVRDPALVLAAARGSVEGALVAVTALVTGPRAPRQRRRQVLLAHPGAELYGSDRVLLDTVQGLVGAGDQVTVTVPVTGPLVPALEALGARVVLCRAPVVRKAVLRPAGAARAGRDAVLGVLPALRLVLTAGRDGVLVNTVTLPSWVVLSRLARRPVVCHVHEAETGEHPLLRRALALPATLSDGVVANSRFSRDNLAAAAPAVGARTTVVYNAVPARGPVSPPREHLDGPVRLLFIGRVSPRKGTHVAIAVLAELRRRGLPADLTLLGDVFPGYEWYAEQLRAEIARAGVEDAVQWEGFRSDVWPSLAAADVVLIPSEAPEPFGNTAVEASVAGRPAVVSDIGGLPEAVRGRQSVRLVPPGRVDDWADAVQELVGAWPSVRAAAEADAAHARSDFAPERYRREMTDELHRSWDRSRRTR